MAKKVVRKKFAVAYDVHVQIAHIAPPIWRRLLVPSTTSLDVMHVIIQEAFGWQDYHLYSFERHAAAFERPNPESSAEDATRITLADLALSVSDELRYIYDFGDDWEHQLRIDAILPLDPNLHYPHCLDGARAGPPEDTGGPPGYEHLLTVLGNRKHPSYSEMRAWVGAHFHPEVFDVRATNRIFELAFE